MCNQFIQKIFPEYLVCAELWDGYSRRDQDSSESNPWCFRKEGRDSWWGTENHASGKGVQCTGTKERGHISNKERKCEGTPHEVESTRFSGETDLEAC